MEDGTWQETLQNESTLNKTLAYIRMRPAQWYSSSFADPVWWGPGFNSWQWWALAVDLEKSQW